MSCSYYTFRQGDYYCYKKKDYVNEDCYRRYCRDYSYDECPIYRNEESSSGCFLTSACVEARGLPDDCDELQTLRAFRDNWLRQQPGGAAEIQAYYQTGPAIVAALRCDGGTARFDQLYRELVLPCVADIKAGRMEEAYRRYRQTVVDLRARYLNEVEG